MWDCFKECVGSVLPWAGLFTLGLIVAGLIGLTFTTGGLAAAGAVGVAKVIGVAIGADAIGTLLGCLFKCL